MKKILIISYLFAPQNTIGAIRATKIAKYLKKNNYEITVVTYLENESNDFLLNQDIKTIDKIVRLKHSSFYLYLDKKINNKVKSKKKITYGNENNNSIKKNKSWLKKKISFFIRQFLLIIKSYDFLLALRNYLKDHPEFIEKQNVLISSYGPLASIICALYVKKRYPSIYWICDFRDPMINEDLPNIMKIAYSIIQNRSCKKCETIVAVSTGYLNRICKDKYTSKRRVITNGFDPDDLSKISINHKLRKFSFVYVGSLYEGKRDLTPLFRVFRDLIDEKKINKKKIEFWYAGSDASFLKLQAKQYSVEDIVIDYGYLSRKDCLELQDRASFLVLSTWNNIAEEGVMPGKLLEYMLFSKPIIALVNGIKKNSEAYDVVTKAELGIAYEQIQDKDHYIKLKEYILNQYNMFIKKGEIFYNPKAEIVNNYDYNSIIHDFKLIIDNNTII